jgi:hypothetical protein
MSLVLALAMLGQPSRAEIASLAASYHRTAWEIAGRPTAEQAASRFNAQQSAQATRPHPPAPIPMAELERRAWSAWLFRRYGFDARPCR